MLTTKQVRAIIRKHIPNAGSWYNPIWTNKVKDLTVRNVKCYDAGDNTALIAELQQLAGTENVRTTPPAGNWSHAGGIIVTCRPA